MDGGPHSVVRGQISRNSLNPIWIWISRDLLPREAKSYSDAINRALGAEEHANALAHVESFHEIALARIRNALASQENKNRVRDRLAMYMGQPRTMADLHEIVTVLTIRHPLAAVAGKLPQHIEALCGDDLATAIRSLDEAGPLPGDALIYALLIVMRRLTEPWQLVRIAAAAATRKSEAANAPYRLAIMLVVAEMEDLLAQLRGAMKADETAEIGTLIRAMGAALKGLAAEIDLSAASWAAQKLSAVRNEAHALLAAEIDGVPVSVKRLLDLPIPSGHAALVPGDDAVAATEQEITLVQFVRPFAAALALGTHVSAALAQIRAGVERAIASLLKGLRNALDGARKFCLLQISHAIRIAARLFGKQYASTLVAATERAIDEERRAA